MTEPQNQLELASEILSDLSMYQEDGEPIEVWYRDETEQECCETGFIATIGMDFVLMTRLFQHSWLNGFRAIRLDSIQNVLPAEDTSFILRAMRASKQGIPPQMPFQASTFVEFLECVCKHYPVVIVNDNPAKRNTSGIAGSILGVKDGLVHFRQISKDGRWIEEPRQVAVCQIVHVFFGSRYEETLLLVAELSDS